MTAGEWRRRNDMKHFALQFSKFMLVGGVSTALHYMVLIALVSLLNAGPVTGSAVGYICGGILNYLLNYKYTFTSSKSHSETVYKFTIVATVGFFLNSGLMQVLTTFTGLHYIVSQITTTAICLVWNFYANRYWTFLHR